MLILAGITIFCLYITVGLASATGPFAYFANSQYNNVTVIDTTSNTVIATVPVGIQPEGVAVSPDGSRVYVANYGNNSVSVINTGTNTVSTTVSVGDAPFGVAVTPDGSTVYVTNSGDANVSVINTSTKTVTSTVTVRNNPYGVAVTPDGFVYVANYGNNSVSVIYAGTNTVTATFRVGDKPYGVAVSNGGSKVYVANSGGANVSIIDTIAMQVAGTVAVGQRPNGIAVAPNGTRAFVTDSEEVSPVYADGGLWEIQTISNTATIVPTVSLAEGVAVTPDGSTAYVETGQGIRVINTSTGTVTTTLYFLSDSFGQFIGPVIPAPVITGISPNQGPLVGGTTVSISGSGFTGATGVTFGSTAASSFNVVNDTIITATSPAGTAGTFNITVTTPGGTSAMSPADYYTYTGGESGAPIAGFTTNITSGIAPMTVQFTDTSTGSPTMWNWSFGDGIWDNGTSLSDQNPVHTYTQTDDARRWYDVGLNVTNASGYNSILQPDYIHVMSFSEYYRSISGTPGNIDTATFVQLVEDWRLQRPVSTFTVSPSTPVFVGLIDDWRLQRPQI
ncbi:MAG: IPT/TIG domain-containing protein [Methanoregula sp.]|jgi:YVTN family beta-propeller protein|uniref:IPT/TIG domain-containing protein n=1 Tax=Methanoregula sp. TaxID=2052170 RepID=UPI003D0BDC27